MAHFLRVEKEIKLFQVLQDAYKTNLDSLLNELKNVKIVGQKLGSQLCITSVQRMDAIEYVLEPFTLNSACAFYFLPEFNTSVAW